MSTAPAGGRFALPSSALAGCCAAPGTYFVRRSDAKLVGEVVEILADDIELALRLGLAGARAAFARPSNVAGAHGEFLRRREVARMGGAHHDLLGLEVEGLAGHQIDLRLRLVALRDFGAENG